MTCHQLLESETSGQFLSIMFFYHKIMWNPRLITVLFATCRGFRYKTFHIYVYEFFLDML